MVKENKKIIATFYIDSLSKKGNGLGTAQLSADRHVRVEVPFTQPGDTVRALLLRKRSDIFQARLEEIVHPSPERIPAKCIHFGSCGGCKWQTIPYNQQLKIKEDQITKLFLPLQTPAAPFFPMLPADPHWQYRNKMEFSFSSNGKGDNFLGLILQGSRGKVFNLTECHLVHPWFAQAVKAVREWWHESGLEAYHPPSNRGALRTLILREGLRTGDKLAMLTVSGNPEYALKRQHLDSFVAYLRASLEPEHPLNDLCIFLRIQQAIKGRPTEFYEMHLYGPDHINEKLEIGIGSGSIALNFKISPSAFFQPNTGQAEKIYSRALQMVNLSSAKCVYDLYCGTGTLGICAAKTAKQVVGIELSAESSLDARENARGNGLSNIAILTGDVAKVLKEIEESQEYAQPDLVMVDPPRTGLDEAALAQLIKLNAPQILYISCNPTTQERDIKILLNHGYTIKEIQPIDQFPHTVHVENIVVLVHSGR